MLKTALIAKGREPRTRKVAYLWRNGNYMYEIERTGCSWGALAGGVTRSTFLNDTSYEDAMRAFRMAIDEVTVYKIVG